MNRAEQVQAYIRRPRGPFVRCVDDCVTFAAGWVRELSGAEILPGFLGERRTLRAALRQIRADGGMVAACGKHLSAAGWRVAETPAAGDIAVVPCRGAPGGGTVGVVGGRGVILVRDEAGYLRVWRGGVASYWRWTAAS